MTEPAMDGAAPLIVRVAGLPAAVMEPFASPLADRLCAADRIEGELSEVRARMVELLHAAVHGAPPALRRSFLAVKRDCFNGRPLARHAGAPHWGELCRIAGGLAERILALESGLAQTRAGFAAAYEGERQRERRHLARLAEVARMRRAIALASPDLAGSRGLPDTLSETEDRKTRSLETSLLRYVSRAALKLSPYSTFTRLGLGLAGTEEGELALAGAGWHERSLVRLKRYLIDQYVAVLLRWPGFRDGLEVVLNDTVEEVEPGRYRWLRPAHWRMGEREGWLTFSRDALVRVGLNGELPAWLLRELPRRPRTWGELVAEVEAALPRGAGARLAELLDLGFLLCRFPWPAEEPHLERRLAEHLRALSGDGRRDELLAALDRLIALETSFAGAAAPEEAAGEIGALVDEVWRNACRLADLDPETRRVRLPRGNVYEDVFVLPAGGNPGAVFRLPESAVRGVLDSLTPWMRLARLHDQRQDFLLTLAAFMREQWPGCAEVPVVELFGRAQRLWQEFRKVAIAARGLSSAGSTFNPCGLARLEELRAFREEVWQRVGECVHEEDGEQRICAGELADLLAKGPEPLDADGACCLFLQPAGALWVLNQMREGTGRYGSRFTAVMDEETRRRYTAHLTACARSGDGAGAVELLDVICPSGDTLNVHAVQTPKVLALPGERCDLPPARCLTLRDLRVRLDERGLPLLVDGLGARYLAVHLGGAGHDFMPSVVKFLSLLGPGELFAAFLPRAGVEAGGGTVLSRLRIGDVVLARRRWLLPPEPLLESLAQRKGPEAFAAVHRWRTALGLPDRVFLRLRFAGERSELTKPQYIDFTSPLLVSSVHALLSRRPARVIVEEMLPRPEMLPRDAAGEAWGVELLLDTLALRRSSLWPRTPVLGSYPHREIRPPVVGAGDSTPTEPWAHFQEEKAWQTTTPATTI